MANRKTLKRRATKKRQKMRCLLDCYEAVPCSPKPPQTREEQNMQTLNIVTATSGADTLERQQKSYLENRLYSARREQRDKMRAAFGLADDTAPRTPQEMVDRITAGKYVFKNEDELADCSSDFYYTPWRYIKWRDPAVKEDCAGFAEADKLLDKAVTDTMDAIMVKSPEEALTAIKELEATEFSATA